jgi:hypothetical protein
LNFIRSPIAPAGRLVVCALTACAAAACALSACGSDDPVEPPKPAPPPVWSEITGVPPAFTFYGLWVLNPNYVIAVGPSGRIARWDGQRWSPIEDESGHDLYCITGSTGGPIVAAGNTGTVVRFESPRFIITETSTSEHLRGVWMASPGDIFVVGDGGTILRGDGAAWTLQPSPTTLALTSVWGAGADDVFAVGLGGTILRFDGTGWSAMASGTTEILASVSGTSSSDVYAVGASGTILHFDGNAWSAMGSGTTEILQSVWATGGPIAVGANGAILRLDQGVWTRDEGVTDQWLYGVARAADHVWVVGANAIHRHDGTEWTAPTPGAIPALRAVASASASELLVGGEDGYLARGHRSGSWRVEDTGTARQINALWRSPAGETFAVGINRIMRCDGAQWVVESSELMEFHDVGGAGSSIYAVGALGSIRRRVSGAWIAAGNFGGGRFHAVSMASDHAGYIAGENGVAMRLEGGRWQSMSTRTTADLFDIIVTPGDDYRAVAVGEGGVILKLTTSAVGWAPMASPTTAPLYALAWGPGDHLYAVGGAGTFIRLVDDTWGRVPVPTSRTLLDACTRGETLFISGGDTFNGGVLYRFGSPSGPSSP